LSHTGRHPEHDNPEEQKILKDAEAEWEIARRLALAAALENLMISRENMSRLHAEHRAGQIAARVKFLVIYPWLLYHSKCVKGYGKEIQYPVRYSSLFPVFLGHLIGRVLDLLQIMQGIKGSTHCPLERNGSSSRERAC
jgi:hypothetical protein